MISVIRYISRMLGWCPMQQQLSSHANFRKAQNVESISGSNNSDLKSITLTKTSVFGLGKESAFSITFALVVFLLTITDYNLFFVNYGFGLMLLPTSFFYFFLSSSKIEINNKQIVTKTCLSSILGSSVRNLCKVDKVKVKNNQNNKWLLVALFFVIVLWIFVSIKIYLLSSSIHDALYDLTWVIFLSALAYMHYRNEKYSSYLEISFHPFPAINKTIIYTDNAQKIASFIDDVGNN